MMSIKDYLEYSYMTKVKGLKLYWIVGYTYFGDQFGITLFAKDDEDLARKFHKQYEDADMADYGEW